MTNTTDSSLTERLASADIRMGSPFSHPLLVLDALKAARRFQNRAEVGVSLQSTITELIGLGLVAQTVNRHRGFRVELSLTVKGRARLSAANNAARYVASRSAELA